MPSVVEVGDFDGDDHPDLVTINNELGENQGQVAAFINKGDGTLNDKMSRSLNGHTAVDGVVGDVNADGKLDLTLVTTTATWSTGYTPGYGYYNFYSYQGHVKVLLGHGDGSFSDGSINDLGGETPTGIVQGDLNGDGDLDIAVASVTGIRVLLGNGDGTFAPPLAPVAGAGEMNLADLNADGKLDLLAMNGSSIGSFLGNGDGTFQTPQITPVDHASSRAVGDVNGDGKLDLVTSLVVKVSNYSYQGSAQVLIGNGNGTFALGDTYPLSVSQRGQWPLRLADVSGDGKLDVVTPAYDAGGILVLRGNGNATFQATELLPAGIGAFGPYDIAVADLNGDTLFDVATANHGLGTLSVILNDGTWPAVPAAISVSDATVTEGNTGTIAAVFTVTLSAASSQSVTVNYATANGSATANADYQSTSGTLTFAPGETSKTINVLIKGDRTAESDENFFVNLSGPSGATLTDAQGSGTIVDDEPRISISDVSKKEGNSGTTQFVFTVGLSLGYDAPVSVKYATAAGSAAVGSDFQSKSGTLTFASGQTSQTITVLVTGDQVSESDETFSVNLSNATSAAIADAQGIGTILDDDERRIAISDVSKKEDNSGVTQFVFTVSLSSASTSAVTVDFATANGSATKSDHDYDGKSGKLTFAPGQTSKTITISVYGDTKKESDETFYVNLSNARGGKISDDRGVGTIVNDDSRKVPKNQFVLWSAIEDAMDDFLQVKRKKVAGK